MLALLFFLDLSGPAQNVVHPTIGTVTWSSDGAVSLRLVHKIQHFDWQHSETFDKDIDSPKSVNFHPNGKKFYVNSLEGCATAVYETGTWRKIKIIHHNFSSKHSNLWAKPCGLFPFRHYSPDSMNVDKFSGKPSLALRRTPFRRERSERAESPTGSQNVASMPQQKRV